MAMEMTTPAGTANAHRLRMNPSRRTGPSLRDRAMKNAGMPMVSDEVMDNCRGRKGKATGSSANARRMMAE